MKIIDVFNLDAAMEQLENVRGVFQFCTYEKPKDHQTGKDYTITYSPEIPGYRTH